MAPVVADFGMAQKDLPSPPPTEETEKIGLVRMTPEGPPRFYCKGCGSRLYGIVPSIKSYFFFQEFFPGAMEKFPPKVHTHYAEKVLSIKDGLPKHRAFPPFSPDQKPDLIDE